MAESSMVCVEQIKTIDKRRLGNYINNVNSFDSKIDDAIKHSLELV